MAEKVLQWMRLKIKLEFFLILLACLIPFHQRFYKFLQSFSVSLVQPGWKVPEYFEIHFDTFLSDFVLLGLIFWILKKRMISWRGFWEGESKYLTLFLFFGLASIANSNFIAYPLPYWRWMHLVLPAFLYFALCRKGLNEGAFKKLAQVVLITACLESGIAIIQYFVQHSLGLKGLGEPTLIARHFTGPHFPMADGSIWIFDRFFHGARNNSFVLRASGTLPHPNVLGGFLVFSLLMTYYLYGIGKRRGWLSLAILLQTFALFITYSRAAIFTAAFMTLFWIAFRLWRDFNIKSIIGVTAGSFLLSLGLLYPQIFHRGGIVSYNVVAQNSDALRLTVQDVGMAMFKAHPFLGVGFNNYMMAFKTFAQGQSLPATYIHNVYLHLGVEIGLFGVLSFLIFVFFVLIKGWKKRLHPEGLTCLCIFLGLLIIGLADYYPLCLQQMRLIFFLMAGLLVAPRKEIIS